MDSIKNGFSLINKQWQLVIVQFVLSLIGCVGFFLIVGIPLIAIVIALGLDVAEITKLKDYLFEIESPIDLLKSYLGIGLVLIASITLYAAFAFSLWIYGLGGSSGVIASAIRDKGYRFSTHGFMIEAKRHFYHLLGYTTLVGAILLLVFFVLGIIGGGLVAISSLLGNGFLGKFISVMSVIALAISALGLMFISMAVILFGVGLRGFDEIGVVETLKMTLSYFKAKPSIMGLFVLVFLGYMVIYGSFASFAILLGLIPLIGQIVLIPYQLFLYALQGYLNLVILASLMSHYWATQAPKDSTPLSDTSEESP